MRWKRALDPSCPLCAKGRSQTNKHVLSNCDSPIALERYTGRHNKVLLELATWVLRAKAQKQSLFVDLINTDFGSIGDIFNSSCRPDLAISDESSVIVLELTVCHETNLEKSKTYKQAKYANIVDSIAINFK